MKALGINGRNLIGSLDLNDFINLEGLTCYNNQLTTSLSLDKCLKLKKIECHENHLTQINLPKGESLELL